MYKQGTLKNLVIKSSKFSVADFKLVENVGVNATKSCSHDLNEDLPTTIVIEVTSDSLHFCGASASVRTSY